jgi:hypothetical protein
MALGRGASVAMPLMAGLGTRRLVGHPAALAGHDAVRSPQPDVPVALADLELTQLRGAQLRDQRGQELVGQPRDSGVIRPAGSLGDAAGPAVGAFLALGACLGHRSDLLVGRRIVAP